MKRSSLRNGTPLEPAKPFTVREHIRDLARVHADALKENIDLRVDAMLNDVTSHFLIYRVLGISDDEGQLIDSYQNKGRFLYKYAGSFLEQAAKTCFKAKFLHPVLDESQILRDRVQKRLRLTVLLITTRLKLNGGTLQQTAII